MAYTILQKPRTNPHSMFYSTEACVPIFLNFSPLSSGRLQTVNTCTSLIQLFPTCDEWNRLWQRQISLPLQIKRVIGSWYRDIVSSPFCLHYQAFWNRVGGVGGGELFDHWSPWPCLKGLNLSWPYQGIFFFFEPGWRSGCLPGKRMLWWNWQGCFSTWVEMEGCNELAG